MFWKKSPAKKLGKKITPSKQPIVATRIPELEKALGYTFTDPILPTIALTHRSAKRGDKLYNYERLEFLGDAVLDLAMAHLLLDTNPESTEGELSKKRAALVNTQTLARTAKGIGLGRWINLSFGERESGGAEKPSILADVMEAIIGAVYIDGGFDKAFEVIKKHFHDLASVITPKDPKTELQEKLHSLGRPSPTYQLEVTEGPDHSPTFISVVQVADQILGRGKGANKKSSEQAAAEVALTELINNTNPLEKKNA